MSGRVELLLFLTCTIAISIYFAIVDVFCVCLDLIVSMMFFPAREGGWKGFFFVFWGHRAKDDIFLF